MSRTLPLGAADGNIIASEQVNFRAKEKLSGAADTMARLMGRTRNNEGVNLGRQLSRYIREATVKAFSILPGHSRECKTLDEILHQIHQTHCVHFPRKPNTSTSHFWNLKHASHPLQNQISGEFSQLAYLIFQQATPLRHPKQLWKISHLWGHFIPLLFTTFPTSSADSYFARCDYILHLIWSINVKLGWQSRSIKSLRKSMDMHYSCSGDMSQVCSYYWGSLKVIGQCGCCTARTHLYDTYQWLSDIVALSLL